jgi:hypothetical protein
VAFFGVAFFGVAFFGVAFFGVAFFGVAFFGVAFFAGTVTPPAPPSPTICTLITSFKDPRSKRTVDAASFAESTRPTVLQSAAKRRAYSALASNRARKMPLS